MKAPTTLAEAATGLEEAFRTVAEGGNPRVIFMGRDQAGDVKVLVHYHGNELVRCTRVEAWLTEMGAAILSPSHTRDDQTLLLYANRKRK